MGVESRVAVLVVLPIGAAVLSWIIGSAWYEATGGLGPERGQAILWTALILSIPVALLGAHLRREEGGRGLALLAGFLSVVFAVLPMVVLFLLYPPT
jgi:hypothetical protein